MFDIHYRKPVWNSLGVIDCEILHPYSGWIRFTASPNDPAEHGRLLFEHLSRELGPMPEVDEPDFQQE